MMRPPPPLLALLAALAQKAMAKGATPTTSIRATVASATAVMSVGLAGTASHRFRGQGTTVDPIHPARASSLVTTGPNAITRNPMYVGMAGLLVANSVRLGSWRALLPAAAFVAVIDRFQVAAEERALVDAFGADYDAYRAAVPRWLGRRR
jgi:protein-S-isoprenylcysteine O-methyltransferase Ste14